jgi:hypothetical protein
MSKKIIVKQWDGKRTEFELMNGQGYDDLTKMIIDSNNLEQNSKLKFVYEGKIITKDNFHIIKPMTTIMVFYTLHPDQPSTSKTNQLGQPEKLYNFKQIKTAIIVFLNFVKNNPQVKKLHDTDYDAFIEEVMTNPIIGDIIKNILSQSSQILENMENGQNISVNINGDDEIVEKINLSSEDEKNINDIIEMGFEANIVCKTYAEFSISTPHNGDMKKELTLKKLLNM